MYLKPSGKIIEQVKFSYHCYADDVQCCMSVVCNSDQFSSTLSSCLSKIAEWMENNKLHSNHDKTQLMIFATRSPNTTIYNAMINNDFADDIVKPSTVMKNLGVIFDSGLSFESEVNNVVKNVFIIYEILVAFGIILILKPMKLLMQCMIMSQIDRSSFLYANLLLYLIDRLQKIQNTAESIISQTRKFDHITPVVQNLHWLPVQHIIMFKILL